MRNLIFIGITIIGMATLSACRPEHRADNLTGYVEAELIYVSTSQPGRILALPFKQGDNVKQGQLMLTLDDEAQNIAVLQAIAQLDQANANAENLLTGLREEELRSFYAQLDEAKASLNLARVQKERGESLVEIGATTQAQQDQIDAEYQVATARVKTLESKIKVAKLPARPHQIEAAQAQVAVANEAFNYALWQKQQRHVFAPVDSRVEQVLHHKGEFVGAGMPIYTLIPNQGLKVTFFVPEALLSSLTMGQRIKVINPVPNADISFEEATVSFIARHAEFTPPIIYSSDSREKLVFMVEARFIRWVSLRPGQPVDVVIP